MTNDNDWFAPKTYGYGSGMPIRWQGWVVMAVFLAATVCAAVWLVPANIPLFLVLVAIASAALMVVCAQHTRGGWKWRWGGEE